MDIENRVKYYMGKWYNTKIEIENPKQYEIVSGRIGDRILLLNKEKLITNPRLCRYSKYLVDNATLFQDNFFLHAIGDVIHNGQDLPVICKTTNLTDHHIITKLNHKRHWNLVTSVRDNDIAYHLKKNSIVWRGSTTNYNEKPVRICAVNKYHTHEIFNIGYHKCAQGRVVTTLKPRLSLKEQLEYKFILSIEGNDVASGLKWQLYSNSVVIMAKPTCISWAMEDKLIPYVHYIPVKDDYSDLEEIFEWGLTHEAECMEISKNAKAFIEQFLDEEKEQEIHRRIIKRYIQNVTIKSAEIQEILHDN